MANSDSNFFDKLCDSFGNCMTMEQIAKFALASKVILSYKIDFLNSFHDQLMEGSWKRSSNGCIYPFDSGYEKILYVEINEDYEVNLEKSLEKLRNLSARNVFDEMPDSDLSSKQGQISLSEDNQGTNVVISDVGKNNEIQLGGECTHGYENEEIESHGISLSHNHHLMDELNEFWVETESDLIEGIQQPNAYHMLDELPLPTFIKDMVEGDKLAEPSLDQGEVDIIYEDSDDFLAYKQIFAKLGTLDGPYFWDLVILGASRARFSKLQSVVHMGSPTSDHLLLADEHYDGSLTPKCPLIQVKNKSLIVSYTLPSMSSAKNVVWPFLLDDLEWFAGSSLSMIFGMEVYNTRVFKLENGRGTFLTLKPPQSSGTPSILCDNSMLTLTVLELNIRSHCAIDKTDRERLISVDSIWAMLDKIDIIVFPSYGISSQFFDSGVGKTIFVLDNSFTLEDKGYFRGDEGGTCEECPWESLIAQVLQSNYNISRTNKSVVLLPCVFDPGGFYLAYVILVGKVTEYLPGSILFSVMGLSFGVSMLSDWLTKQESLLSYKHHFSCSTVMLALVLTLEDKGDFKRKGVYPLITHKIYATMGYVIWSMKYIESMNLTWDPGIIDKIAYEQFRTSNELRLGYRKDIILLTLRLMKYWAASYGFQMLEQLDFASLISVV